MIPFISVELQPFLERALADPRLDSALVPVGKGLLLGRKTAPAQPAAVLLKIQVIFPTLSRALPRACPLGLSLGAKPERSEGWSLRNQFNPVAPVPEPVRMDSWLKPLSLTRPCADKFYLREPCALR